MTGCFALCPGATGINTFLRDGAYVTDPVVKDSNATYTPGISERRAGSTRLLSHNLKSVDTQSTTTPSVSAWKVYDAFGNVTSSAGTFLGPFGYGGGSGYQEEATGLKLLGHRYYDSSTGRFLTRDPIKDGRNWYVYCANDPISRADPAGLDWHDPSHIVVTPGFKGKVWVVGEMGKGKPQVIREVKPGGVSPIGMDVDIVIIQHPGGTQDRYFVPGGNIPQDPRDEPSEYIVMPDGSIRPVPRPPLLIIPFLPVPNPLPIGPPWKFGPGKGGDYPPGFGKGNWNDDIEKAKKNG